MQNAQKPGNAGASLEEVRRADFRCPDLDSYQASVASCWEMDDVQLDSGRLDASISLAATRNVLVGETRINAKFHAGGCLDPQFVAFGIVTPSSASSKWRGETFSENQIAVLRGGGEVDMFCQQGHQHLTLIVRRDALEQAWWKIGGTEPDFLSEEGDWIRVDHADRTAMGKSLQMLAGNPHLGGPQFEEAAFSALFRAIGREPRLRLSASRSRALVGRAIQVADEDPASASIAEICRRLRVSKRTLEYAWKQNLQTTPSSYLKSRRLNHCRRALLEADPRRSTVTETAVRFGFTELGRFSADFRSLFGDYPSETLHKKHLG